MVRRSFAWANVSGDEDSTVRWLAPDIAKHLGMKRDEHIGLLKFRGRETVLGATSQLHMGVDIPIRDHDPGEEVPGTPFGPIEKHPTVDTGYHTRGAMEIAVDASGSFIAEDSVIEPLEVYESIVFTKAATSSWRFHLDFVYLEDSMRWPIEDFMKDVRKVGRETSAGNPYHQVGDRFVIGERER